MRLRVISLCFLAAIVSRLHGAATSTIFTANTASSISTVSLENFTQSAEVIPLDISSSSMILSPDSRTFYVEGYLSTEVEAIDRNTKAVVQTYLTQSAVQGPLAVSPNGSTLFVVTCVFDFEGCLESQLEVFDTGSGAALGILSIGTDVISQVVATAKTAYAIHYYAPPPCCDLKKSNVSAITQSQMPPSNAVTAFDVSSLQIENSFVIPGVTPQQMLLSPNGKTAYVTAGALYRIDLPTMAISNSLVIPGGAGAMAISEDGSTIALGDGNSDLLFVATNDFSVNRLVQGVQGSVVGLSFDDRTAYLEYNSTLLYQVSAAIGAITPELQGCELASILIDPKSEKMFVISSSVAAFHEGATVPFAHLDSLRAGALGLSHNGQTLYATSDGGITAISLSNGQTRNFPTAQGLSQIAVSPDDKYIYGITNDVLGANFVYTIDAATGVTKNTIPVSEGYPINFQMALSPDGKRIYATGGDSVSIISTRAQKIVGTLASNVGGIVAVDPKGDELYLSIGTDIVPVGINVYSTSTYQVIATIPGQASSIAFSPDGSRVYLGEYSGGAQYISVVDTATHTQTATITGVQPGGYEALAVTRDGSLLYVSGVPGVVIDTASLQIVSDFPAEGNTLIIR